jgi:hypothetical protein
MVGVSLRTQDLLLMSSVADVPMGEIVRGGPRRPADPATGFLRYVADAVENPVLALPDL